MRKKLILGIAILVISILSISVIAQEFTRPKIKTIGILGMGIAISPSDPKVFKLLKIGVARVIVTASGERTEMAVGILHLDNETYRIRNITIGNGTVSGLVYHNDTQVGSFEVFSVTKGDLEIWAGTLAISGENWNIYVLEGKRPFKAAELGEKVSDECEEEPDECKGAMRGIGPDYCEKTPEDPSCREKIRNWCEDHPVDQRCIVLLRNYCKFHIEDSRCREALREFCQNNTENEKCKFFELKITEKYCERHPLDEKCMELNKKRLVEYCLNHPNEDRCVRLENATEFMQRARLAMFCKNNPTDERCEDFCEDHPIACRTPPLASTNETGTE